MNREERERLIRQSWLLSDIIIDMENRQSDKDFSVNENLDKLKLIYIEIDNIIWGYEQ